MDIYYNNQYRWFSCDKSYLYVLDKQYVTKGYAIYIGEPVKPEDYNNNRLLLVNGFLLKKQLYKLFRRYNDE